jgi:tetratricopeptide (TPR) repeat protein
MLFRLKTIIPLLLLIALEGCSSTALKEKTVLVNRTKNQVNTAVIKKSSEDDQIDVRAYNYYVNGTIFEEMNDYEGAADQYKRALQIYPTSYQIRLSLAQTLFQMQQYVGALETLETINPEDSDVWQLRAACFRQLGEINSARAAYLEVINVDSSNTLAYSYLASLYRQQEKLDSVIWAYQNLLRLRPDNYRLWSELGKLYTQQRSLTQAQEAYWKSIELVNDESNIIAYILLGELYESLGKNDSALMIYHNGAYVAPDDIMINRMIANLYVHMDSLTQAIPYARSVVELSPFDRTAIRRLGSICFGADSLDRADSIFSSLVDIGDRHPLNYYYLGRVSILNENYQRSLEFFVPLTQIADSIVETWLDLAYVYRQLGDETNELATYRNGLNHMRDEESGVQLLFALGAAYERYNHFQEAVEIFEEIIAQVPNHYQAMNYLGYMLADRGERLEYARDLLEQVITNVPDNPAYLDSYGWVYYRMGNYKKALIYLEEAVTLDNDPVILDHLGDAYKAVGDMESARQSWRKALEISPDNDEIREKLNR